MVQATMGGLSAGVRTDVLEEVQRDEGRASGVGPRRVIFTGSREWGEDRGTYPSEWVEHERQVSAAVVTRLVARFVVGMPDKTTAKVKGLQAGPGLVVVHGLARGLDSAVDSVTRALAAGQRRLTRDTFRTFFVEPQLAPGMWLEAYPADWAHRPRALAGPERNQQMLDLGADQVVAFFAHGRAYGAGISGGTNDMVRRAVQAGIEVDIYEANNRRWRKP